MKRIRKKRKVLVIGIVMALVAMVFAGMSANISAVGTCPEGMVSYWKFEEGEGTTASDSIGDNDGTIYGATWTTGIVGGALSFDGTNDYVRILGPLGSFSNEITVEAWMKVPNPYKFRNTIVGTINMNSGLGTNIYFGTGNFAEGDAAPHFAFMIDGKRPYTVGEPDSIKANIWQHLAGVYDGSYMKLYLDGELVDSTAITGNIQHPSGGILIGHYIYDARHYFNGIIDEVAIWNIALTSDEVLLHYTNGLIGKDYCYVPPDQAIQYLFEDIQNIEDLPGGAENSLLSKLDSALDCLDKGNDNAGKNILNAFINSIEAQSGKKLTVEQADELIAAAEKILETLDENAV